MVSVCQSSGALGVHVAIKTATAATFGAIGWLGKLIVSPSKKEEEKK